MSGDLIVIINSESLTNLVAMMWQNLADVSQRHSAAVPVHTLFHCKQTTKTLATCIQTVHIHRLKTHLKALSVEHIPTPSQQSPKICSIPKCINQCMHYLSPSRIKNPKWKLAGHFEYDRPQNLMASSHVSSPQPTRFHENRVIPLKGKQTDSDTGCTNSILDRNNYALYTRIWVSLKNTIQ